MRHFYAKLSICLMVLSGLWSTLSAQQLDNFDEGNLLTLSLSVGSSISQEFQTGGSSYTDVSITLNLIAISLSGFTVRIHDDNGGEPGSIITTLTGPGILALGNVTYSGSVALAANTTYHIVASNNGILGLFSIGGVNNGNIEPPLEGFSAPDSIQTNSGGGWITVTDRRFRFTLTASPPLPVELTAFNAFKKDTEVALQWETAAEINNEGFAIERSADGRSWELLDFVSGHGTTEQAIRYQWMDEQPLRGHNYYRLKQMDFDGKFEYSPVVQVDFSESGDFEVFPNPATEVLQYQLGAEQEVLRLQVYGQDGRLFHESERIDGQLDLSNFPAGRYILRLITAKGSMQKTFIVR